MNKDIHDVQDFITDPSIKEELDSYIGMYYGHIFDYCKLGEQVRAVRLIIQRHPRRILLGGNEEEKMKLIREAISDLLK